MFKIVDKIIAGEWRGYHRWKDTEWKLTFSDTSRIRYLHSPSGTALEILCPTTQLYPILAKYEQKTDFKDWEIADLAQIQERRN